MSITIDSLNQPTFLGVVDVGTKKLHVGLTTRPDQPLAYNWGLPMTVTTASKFKWLNTHLVVGGCEHFVTRRSFQRHCEERGIPLINSRKLCGSRPTCDYDARALAAVSSKPLNTTRFVVDALSEKQRDKATSLFRQAIADFEERKALHYIQEGAHIHKLFGIGKNQKEGWVQETHPNLLKPKSNQKRWGRLVYGDSLALAVNQKMQTLARALDDLQGHHDAALRSYKVRFIVAGTTSIPIYRDAPTYAYYDPPGANEVIGFETIPNRFRHKVEKKASYEVVKFEEEGEKIYQLKRKN